MTFAISRVNKEFGVQFHDTPRAALLKKAHYFLLPAIVAYILITILFVATQSPVIELLANILLLFIGIFLAFCAAVSI